MKKIGLYSVCVFIARVLLIPMSARLGWLAGDKISKATFWEGLPVVTLFFIACSVILLLGDDIYFKREKKQKPKDENAPVISYEIGFYAHPVDNAELTADWRKEREKEMRFLSNLNTVRQKMVSKLTNPIKNNAFLSQGRFARSDTRWGSRRWKSKT